MVRPATGIHKNILEDDSDVTSIPCIPLDLLYATSSGPRSRAQRIESLKSNTIYEE